MNVLANTDVRAVQTDIPGFHQMEARTQARELRRDKLLGVTLLNPEVEFFLSGRVADRESWHHRAWYSMAL